RVYLRSGFSVMLSVVNSSHESRTCTMHIQTTRERAQGLVEYGLIIALVAVLAIAGLIVFGPAVSTLLSKLGGSVLDDIHPTGSTERAAAALVTTGALPELEGGRSVLHVIRACSPPAVTSTLLTSGVAVDDP